MSQYPDGKLYQLYEKIVYFCAKKFFRKSFSCNCVADGIENLNERETDKRIILINTPTYFNLGDQAITMASIDYFKKFFSEYQITEVTNRQLFPEIRGAWLEKVRKSDVIAVNGGGNMGDVWRADCENTLETIRLLNNNRVIILPHTFYYNDKNLEADEMKELMSMDNVLVFQRGGAKKQRLTECKEDEFFCPDMCLYYPVQRRVRFRLNKCIVCLRSDKESLLNDSVKKHIEQKLLENNVYPIYLDNAEHRRIERAMRSNAVLCRLYRFAHTKLVVTDRLHGMLFAYLSNTPCIAIGSMTGKTAGIYDWIKKSKRIAYITDVKNEFNSSLILNVMKEKDGGQIPEITQCFEDMASIIRRFIESEDR